MRERLKFSVPEITPEAEAVSESPNERVREHLEQALALFAEIARPAGILSEISIPEFEEVFRGEGKNEPEAPLKAIFPRAEHLALYAVTLGEGVSQKISELFESGDYALGYLLDSVASGGADKASARAGRHWEDLLIRQRRASPEMRVLGYSPGYCGWHLSGQGKLFGTLRPEEIGITLSETFLMQPLKSISGVLVAGPSEIHVFDSAFAFCSECRNRTCRTRMNALRKEP